MGYEYYTLDNQLRRNQLIEGYKSFIWTERYSAYGDAQIITKTNFASRQLLTPGTLIGKNGSRSVMEIKTISDDTDDDGTRLMTVTCKSIEHWLDDRVAMPAFDPLNTTPSWVISGNPGNIIRSLFEQICVEGILDHRDTIPFYVNGQLSQSGDIPEPSDIITVSAPPDTLYNTIESIADAYGIGFRFVKQDDQGVIYFEVYMGDDRTTGQTVRDPVIFDRALDNLVRPSLLQSNDFVKTVAYVFAQNGTAVVYAPTANQDASGSDRRVLLVNSSNDIEAPKTYGFMTDSGAEGRCLTSNPTTTTEIFGVPTSFVSGGNPKAYPTNDGLGYTPILTYKAYAQLKADIQNSNFVQGGITYASAGPIDNSIYEWLKFDIEDWADTPDVESADPEQYIGLFIKLAHDNGFKVMVTPARDLGNSATVHPKNSGEILNDWFVRVNVASWCADADIFEFQDQANMPVPADFTSYFQQVHDQMRELNETIPIWVGISTTYGTGEDMFNRAKSVRDLADGYWVNILNDTANGLDFMTRWLAFAETQETGLIAALEQEGLIALGQQRLIYSFDGEVPPSVNLIYGVDYNLGDLVEERTEDGFRNQMVITEQIFTSDDTGDRSYPTLSILQTITPGSWLAEPVSEHWDDVPETEHWDDL
jgi:Siphovirus ReqiPepy6 Gp37-like protein